MREISVPMHRPSELDPGRIPELLRHTIDASIEKADVQRRLPDELYDELRDCGAFRLLTPRVVGGQQASLVTVLAVYENLARIDASTAWVVWNANFGFIAALLDEAGVSRIWGGGHEPLLANAGRPGAAVPVDGGFRVSGHWRLVSGIAAADWFIVLAAVTPAEDSPAEAAAPDARLFALTRAQFVIQDTWDSTGLRGTGSNDVTVEDAFVPIELAARLDERPRIDEFPYSGFVPALVFPGCSAIVLGVAQAAIDELVRLAPGKRTAFGPLLAEQAHTQSTLARSEAALAAARQLLLSVARDLDAAAEQRTPVTVEKRAELRAAMSHAASVSREVIEAVYELGSSSSIYRGTALERLFRDGMVAVQHANHSAAFFEVAGRVRLGLDPGLPLF
jgi:alkylation response protein AidB-like acyl-CoA dehydrogenase